MLWIKDKQHLTPEGLEKIVAIRISLNLGISGELSKAFPSLLNKAPVRALISNTKIPHADWVVGGFVVGEGSFMIKSISPKSKLAYL